MVMYGATQSAANSLFSSVSTLGPGAPTGYLENVSGTVQAYSTFSVQVSTTGSPAGFCVYLEGSLDGGVTWSYLGQTSGAGIETMTGPGVIQLRGNLITLDGGTNPTVTVTAIGIS